MLVAFCGLALIGLTVGGDLTALGLGLAIAGAFSWAVGNVLLKRVGRVPMLSLIVWLSVVPLLSALLVSALDPQSPSIFVAVSAASWSSLAAVIYLGALAGVLAYALWGYLLARYPAASVVPFALLAPCVGILSSAVIFGEIFTPIRYAGMALILAGMVISSIA